MEEIKQTIGNLEKEGNALLRQRIDEIYKERANTIN